jgi:hypothetical protein
MIKEILNKEEWVRLCRMKSVRMKIVKVKDRSSVNKWENVSRTWF